MNTDCESNAENLSALADGELTGWSAWRLRRHVAHCPACAGELADWQRLNAELRTADAFPLTALRAATPSRKRKPSRGIRVALVGATVLSGVAAITLYTAPTRRGSALAARAAVEKAMSQVTTAQWHETTCIYGPKGSVYFQLEYEYVARLDSPVIVRKIRDARVPKNGVSYLGGLRMTVTERDTYQLQPEGKGSAEISHAFGQFLELPSPGARTVYQRLRRQIVHSLYSSQAMEEQRAQERDVSGESRRGFARRVLEPPTERLVTRNGRRLIEIHDADAVDHFKTGCYTTVWASPETHRIVETQHDSIDLLTNRLEVRTHSYDYQYNQRPALGTFLLHIPPGTPLRIDGKPAGVTK